MKIEKITENKIRITLKREEFKDKKIDINELLLTSADSQKLFLEILNQAEKEITARSRGLHDFRDNPFPGGSAGAAGAAVAGAV